MSFSCARSIISKYYLIRREWSSGASWYELTHDRLIKPITDSNTKWKYENERKKRNLVLKVAIPSLTVSVIVVVSVILFVYVINPPHHVVVPLPAKIGDGPDAVSVIPSTNTVYVVNYNDNTVYVIDGKTNKVTANVTVGKNPCPLRVCTVSSTSSPLDSLAILIASLRLFFSKTS